jgi:hypothetical protein
MLPVALHGCEAWPLILREKNRLKVFEDRMPTRIFGPQRVEIIGGGRKLHNKKSS